MNKNQEPINLSQVYTPETAANDLGVTARWIREQLINTGELPCVRRGRLICFTGTALRQWVERNADYMDGESE